jgi:hypothetical protein
LQFRAQGGSTQIATDVFWEYIRIDIMEHAAQRLIVIRSIRADLTVMDERVWEGLLQAREVKAELDSMSPRDRFEHWIETLPFPLASILWNYHADSDRPETSVRRLLLFYEALAEFLAVLQLSAWVRNPSEFESHWRCVSDRLCGQGLSLEMAKFGTWLLILEYFSSHTRKQLSDKGVSDCLAAFCTHNEALVQKLCSLEVVKVLREANSIRNKFHAHGGEANDATFAKTHDVLRDLLRQVQQEFGNAWNGFLLLFPGAARKRNGIYHATVRRVVGSRTPFPSSNIELDDALEDGQLHLWDPQERSALPILPFIKLLSSPRSEDNACYYYNRRENGNLRFVSYHFASEASRVEEFEDVASCLNEFSLISEQ